MNITSQSGFSYFFDPAACRACAGFCCRGQSGSIWVNAREIARIADFFESNQIDIIHRYLTPVDNRLSIRERFADGQFSCVFFADQEKKCSIHAARPDQCRRFPFWEHYRNRIDELFRECPGVRLTPGI
ncbi:MAG: YkgJ family cysteine cluster protein [Desulfobulbaceae bacterium]|nr:YkgJ family cysteine cluster protein [Desulfobulbaceae bacterium]